MKNTTICFRSIFVTFLIACVASAQGTGHIQIECPPGVKIFLDGDFQGVTSSEDGGLVLRNILAGKHTIRAVKDGFQAQEEVLNLSSGKILRYTVKPFAAGVEVNQSGVEASSSLNQEVGLLIIQTLPIDCILDIPSIGRTNERKSKDEFQLKKVPIGTHSIFLRSGDKRLRCDVNITRGQTTRVMADFFTGKTEVTYETGEKEEGKGFEKPGAGFQITSIKKASYGIGLDLGRNTRRRSLEVNWEEFKKGFRAGFSEESPSVSSEMGLRLVKMLGEHQLGGTVHLDRSDGTRVTLQFEVR